MKTKKILFLTSTGALISAMLFVFGFIFRSNIANAATTIGTNIVTDGALTVTGAATLNSTLSVTGAATLSNVSTLQLNNQIKWDTGVAVTASNYSIGRDTDSANQLHLNVPSGAKFEFSTNDNPLLLIGGEGASYLYNNFTVGTNVGSASTTLNVVEGAGAGSGGLRALVVTGGAHTNMAVSVEMPDIVFNLGRTVEFAAGLLGSQRAFQIQAPTYAFTGGSTLTLAATMSIDGTPKKGANATITNSSGLAIGGLTSATTSGATTSDMLSVAPEGIDNGIGAASRRSGLRVTANTISLGNQTATLTDWAPVSISTIGLQSTTNNTRTITNASSLYIEGAPSNGGNVTFTNGPYAIFVDAGNSRFDGNLIVESSGFLQFKANGAGQPGGTDCDEDSERGRFYLDTNGNVLYVCNGATRLWDTILLSN